MMTNSAVLAKLQAVPAGFENFRQFINWYPRNNGEGFDKIPCDRQGDAIDPHDTRYWLSAEEAANCPHDLAFVFSDWDPFFFIDLDAAWDGAKWSELAVWA